MGSKCIAETLTATIRDESMNLSCEAASRTILLLPTIRRFDTEWQYALLTAPARSMLFSGVTFKMATHTLDCIVGYPVVPDVRIIRQLPIPIHNSTDGFWHRLEDLDTG